MRYAVVAAALLLAGCSRLPRELSSEIRSERDLIDRARDEVKRARSSVREAGAQNDWESRLRADDDRLNSADNIRKQLDREDDERRARQLLDEERRLRESAVTDSQAIGAEALRWAGIKHDLPRHAAEAEKPRDFAAVTAAVQKAEVDWPAKKADLESRLASLKSQTETAQARLKASNGTDVAAVMELEKTNPSELEAMAGQLYYSWDRILEDLDANNGRFREKLKTVKTRDGQVSTDIDWKDVPETEYRREENDLGMAVAHKDLGLYDSEAHTIAQPPGYAYIASPSVGRNQYGYWSGGVWTWLPQYLIMRELFWGHSYQPIVINEYNHYYEASRAGRSYYGVEAPNAPPKYGTHGTFTQQRYSSSRYVQSGGFKASGYASHPESGAATAPAKRFGFGSSASGEPGVGKRFGGQPSGRRFGSGSSSGRRFGSGGRRR